MKLRNLPRLRRALRLPCMLLSLCGSVALSFGQSATTAPAAPAAATPAAAAAPVAQPPAAAPATAPAAQTQAMTSTTTDLQSPKIPAEQLDALVAPIALYPDQLLAQTLAASTYPLEIIQLQQWMGKNKNLKDKALMDAVASSHGIPVIQNMAAIPDRGDAPRGEHSMDDGSGERISRPAAGCDGGDSADAWESEDKGTLKTSSETVVKTEQVSGGSGAAAVVAAKK